MKKDDRPKRRNRPAVLGFLTTVVIAQIAFLAGVRPYQHYQPLDRNPGQDGGTYALGQTPAPTPPGPDPPPRQPTPQQTLQERLAQVPNNLVESLIVVESNGNPHAIGDNGRSYGLGQIRETTAQYLRGIFPGLLSLDTNNDGTVTEAERREVLLDPNNNRMFIRASLLNGANLYDRRWDLAVAAHNTGPSAPRFALGQQLLNEVTGSTLDTGGQLDAATQRVTRAFQEQENLQPIDGVPGSQTIERLQTCYQEQHPGNANQQLLNARGAIPQNGATLGYVRRIMQLARAHGN